MSIQHRTFSEHQMIIHIILKSITFKIYPVNHKKGHQIKAKLEGPCTDRTYYSNGRLSYYLSKSGLCGWRLYGRTVFREHCSLETVLQVHPRTWEVLEVTFIYAQTFFFHGATAEGQVLAAPKRKRNNDNQITVCWTLMKGYNSQVLLNIA